jgi:hypothetical protein
MAKISYSQDTFDDYGDTEVVAEEMLIEDIFDGGEFQETDDLFSIMTEIERKNALIKLKSEQEKLQLSLDELKAKKEAARLELEAKTLKKRMEAETEKRRAEALQKEMDAQRLKEEEEARVEAKKQEIIDSLINAILEDPEGDHYDLALLVKKENNGVLPEEIAFMADFLDRRQNEEAKKEAEKQLALNQKGFVKMEQEQDISDLIAIDSIMGIKGELIAVIKNIKSGKTSKIAKGNIVDKFEVIKITNESVVFKKAGKVYTLYMG